MTMAVFTGFWGSFTLETPKERVWRSRMLSQVHSSSSVPLEKSEVSTESSMEECLMRSRSEMIPREDPLGSRIGMASTPEISMTLPTRERGVSSQRAKVLLVKVSLISIRELLLGDGRDQVGHREDPHDSPVLHHGEPAGPVFR